MKPTVYIVILAGGKGERLWPLSRTSLPKQLLEFMHHQSLLELTLDRIAALTNIQNIIAITTYDQQASIATLIGSRIGTILAEPSPRNTAPAILLTCHHIIKQDPHAIVVFLPADHYIPQTATFQEHIKTMIHNSMLHDAIILLGIKPRWPATGYGYIEFEQQDKNQIKKVMRFHEKPNSDVAQMYYNCDNIFWNSGIFCAKASTFLKEFQTNASDLYNNFNDYLNDQKAYNELESISFDYAVLEHCKKVMVLPANLTWSDVGNLDTFLSLTQQGKEQNNIIQIDADQNIIHTKKLTVLIGLENICVVETDDVLLVAKRNDIEKVKQVLHQLKNNNLTHYL